MTDEDTVKAKLRRLAADDETDADGEPRDSPSLAAEHREIIDRATASLDDLDAGVAFLEDDGLTALERAVDAAEASVSGCGRRGRETLAEYRRFRAALSGDQVRTVDCQSSDELARSGERATSRCDSRQFHSGRGTSLGDGDKTPSR